MPRNPNPLVASLLAEFPAAQRDPFHVIGRLLGEYAAGKLKGEQVQTVAASHELAQLASADSTRRLVAFLNEVLTEHGEAAMFAVPAISDHAGCLGQCGRYEFALELYAATLIVKRRYADQQSIALTHNNRAAIYDALGRYEDALREFEAALEVYAAHGPESHAAAVQNNRASTLQALGRLPEALRGYDAALALHEKNRQHIQAAEVRHNRANVLQLSGQLDEALREYGAALVVFDENEQVIQAAQCRENCANVLDALQRHEEALVGYNKALAVYESLGLEVNAAQCRNNLATALDSLGRHAEAAREYARLIPALRNPGERAKATVNLAESLWAAGRTPEAVAAIAGARALYRGARRTAGIDENHLEYMKEANQSVRLAVRYATVLERPVEAFEAAQDGKAAVVGDLMRQLTHAAPADPRLTAMRGDLVALLDQRPATREEARVVRARTRDAAERLIRASRQLAPAGAPVDAAPATVRDLQTCDALPPDWAVVDFWRLENEVVLAFVVTRRGLTCHRLTFPVESKAFSQKLDRLLRSIRHPENAPDDEGLDELGQYLFVPLLDALRREGVRGLYLVPHGYLNALPLHAARWYENRRPVYLCEAFDVAYLPAANLLLTLPPTDWTGGVLSLANPNRHEKGTLPFADWEGRQLREQFGAGGRYFLGADATPGATDDWSDCGLLHFSCHGTGDESFAPLARLMLRGDPLLALDVMHRRATLKTGAHVILNGCETGVKDWRAADEGFGLMTAFLLRGAGTVLATQWCVNDASAAVFTLDYLTHLRAGATPLAALREARRRVKGMRTDEVVRTSDRVVEAFPEAAYPLEAAKSHFQAGIAAHWAENEPKAKTHFATAERLLKDQGMADEAERIAALLRSPRAALSWLNVNRIARFDHPVHWGAFHLIGRVT